MWNREIEIPWKSLTVAEVLDILASSLTRDEAREFAGELYSCIAGCSDVLEECSFMREV